MDQDLGRIILVEVPGTMKELFQYAKKKFFVRNKQKKAAETVSNVEGTWIVASLYVTSTTYQVILLVL